VQEDMQAEFLSVRRDQRDLSQKLYTAQEDMQTIQEKVDFNIKSSSISRISAKKYEQVLMKLNIAVSDDDAIWANKPTGDAPEPFKWLSHKEDNALNIKEYMTYLVATFTLPYDCTLVNMASEKNLFDTPISALPHGGSIDVVLTMANIPAKNKNDMIKKMVMGIELKKSLQSAEKESHVRQGVMQLLNPSALCPDTGVVVLLTDLNEVWRFFWLGPDRKVIRCSTSIVEAQFLVKNLLNPEVANQCPEFFHS
jgi:hypothetical protein